MSEIQQQTVVKFKFKYYNGINIIFIYTFKVAKTPRVF